MRTIPILKELATSLSPDAVAALLQGEAGVVLLHSNMPDSPLARYSFVTARPFLTLRAWGSRCEVTAGSTDAVYFGNPWRVLDSLLCRYELLEEMDLPFPLGGGFGFWGYDLRHFVEPGLSRRAVRDLDVPDCLVGFYSSLLVMDHWLDKTWVVSVGLAVDGSRSRRQAEAERDYWTRLLEGGLAGAPTVPTAYSLTDPTQARHPTHPRERAVHSCLSRAAFLSLVVRAQRYIRAGDIYQVNLAQRLTAALPDNSWEFYRCLAGVSPAPYSAWLDGGDFQIASSSPELFLRLSGSHIRTRPIKGTRPRAHDPTKDAQLTYDLQTSPKEMAELIMITDLLRNDLGRICDYGSVQVPELVRLERYPQVQHLVSTVEGRLRPDVSHSHALSACFPGGSITGAPKIRAMDIIDELEPVARGPYTGCVGYLGFNRESQLSILIRAGLCLANRCHFHVGAGIVADSNPAAEYEETLAKASGFFQALQLHSQTALLG
jgi:para-aminobenzoate synthetase component 1